jgi:hypothetical protein
MRSPSSVPFDVIYKVAKAGTFAIPVDLAYAVEAPAPACFLRWADVRVPVAPRMKVAGAYYPLG